MEALPLRPREVKLSVISQETSELIKDRHREGRRDVRQRGLCSPFHFSSKRVLILAFRSHPNREFSPFITSPIPRRARRSQPGNYRFAGKRRHARTPRKRKRRRGARRHGPTFPTFEVRISPGCRAAKGRGGKTRENHQENQRSVPGFPRGETAFPAPQPECRKLRFPEKNVEQ